MNSLKWKFRKLDKDSEPPSGLTAAIHEVFRDGFAIEGWSPEGIERTLKRCDALGLLLGEGGEVCGYAFYSVPETQLMGDWFLWEDAIGLKKVAQRHGLSNRAIELVRGLYPNRRFGWIGGRTQNPTMMRRYNKHGISYPFDASYSEGDGQKVTDFLVEHVTEVGEVSSFDRSTGICIGVYKDGILGDYPWSDSGHFERRLLHWGFDRTRGDAIVVVTRVEHTL